MKHVFVLAALSAVAMYLAYRPRFNTQGEVSTDLVLPSPHLSTAIARLKSTFGGRAPQTVHAILTILRDLHEQCATLINTAPSHHMQRAYDDMQMDVLKLFEEVAMLEQAAADAPTLHAMRSIRHGLYRRTSLLLRAVRNKHALRATPSSPVFYIGE